MSSHSFTNKSGREVRWGLDIPTGGFFFNEFLKDEEIKNEGDELASTGQALTLTELVKELALRFSQSVDIDKVAYDLENASPPTPLQVNVSRMFGVNLTEKLRAMGEDLEKNWSS